MDLSDFQGVNAAFALELYDRYKVDPTSVDPAARALFERWTPPAADTAGPPPGAEVGVRDAAKVVGAVRLAQSIRRYGHLAAAIDPLGGRPMGDPALLPETHGVTE